MKKFSFIVLIGFCLFFVSCKKQLPQLPSNKGNAVDRSSESMLLINHNLSIKEDSLLQKFVESKRAFKKNEIGFWYQVFNVGNGTKVTDSIKCSFDFKILKLDGKLLQTGNKQIIIGKKQEITGLEEGLKMMHKGDSATFIIPWYLAYGMKGEAPLIPPYTSLIFKIKLLD